MQNYLAPASATCSACLSLPRFKPSNSRSIEAQSYNALVLGWPDLLRLAHERRVATTPSQEKLL